MAKKKQRGNGAGTVYPRKNKDGKIIGYRGSYIVNGKRYYVSAKTKTETEQKLRQSMTDADRGLTFDAGGLRLDDFLDRWLKDSVQDTVRDTTFERYEQIVRVHIKPILGPLKLKNLTPAHVRGLYKEKLQSLSPRTVQYIHVTLHKALKQAVSDGLIPRNVIRRP
jgi:integrase